ncbi:mechanosensitive ion channel family protein [Sinimarinibacterium thermocellulolyticum]|uniref:Mechanosensitive ion channel domain-containing protein n=1 Tax=Sinimarinibacterium thermocellulolyticum TaxID=3170016 RepID=A0ABV2AD74_9GAMM
MDAGRLPVLIRDAGRLAEQALTDPASWVQLGIVAGVCALGALLAHRLLWLGGAGSLWRRLINALAPVLQPAITALLLLVAAALGKTLLEQPWVLRGAVVVAALWLVESCIRALQVGPLAGRVLRIVGVPLVLLHLLGVLQPITAVLQGMSVEIGNLRITASGVLRVLLFGSLLLWLGWRLGEVGIHAIRRQEKLDLRMREVVAKLYQIGLTIVVGLMFLQVMGVDLTALAVFGGALGVGLGFGLQSIASNFISGIIILFDRSINVGDYVEFEDGKAGHVRELTLRYTTIETFDGKDILVPNDAFITRPFTNWTHKDRKQRYRVDFSVAYDTDIRKLCELIRTAVAKHPQVISGDHVPIEERPDCEIDSFGESGVNMFVEFWMEGIDDGRNRVGGDLLLIIFETLRENNIEIPFPQREVRLLKAKDRCRSA